MSQSAYSLTQKLQPVVRALVDDMRTSLHADSDMSAAWRAQFDDAKRSNRVGIAYSDWEDEQLTQAAVGWVVTTVFIRFIEDNELFGAGVAFLSGYSDHLRQNARAFEQDLYRAHPEYSYRAYLEECFKQLESTTATRSLVDEHAAFRIFAPTDDGAKLLVDFWRAIDPETNAVLSLYDDSLNTRFLGDIYENLSEFAQKKYALRQTPEFVEEFILDRTLTPAMNERPLDGFKLIDPTCGSGHFLIGAFNRIFDRWLRNNPNAERRVLARKAMESIHGVDINPFAVAITKFRLIVQYIRALEENKLDEVDEVPFDIAAGDSLLFGDNGDGQIQVSVLEEDDDVLFSYGTEDNSALNRILEGGKYDVVVGNPPYIQGDDDVLRNLYRHNYKAYCKGKFALTAPFMAKFFRLARPGVNGAQSGRVGQITSNSFMQRQFGKPLVEKAFTEFRLLEIIDSSGAYIPGHGTPTVILVGQNTAPKNSRVKVVLGNEGEPGVPGDPANGKVWSSIVSNIDRESYEDRYISVVNLPCTDFSQHPWSLKGGAAPAVSRMIDESADHFLDDDVESIGFGAITGEDPAFVFPRYFFNNMHPEIPHREFIEGEAVRDFSLCSDALALYPFDDARDDDALASFTWSNRAVLRKGLVFKQTKAQRGIAYFEYTLPNFERLNASKLIAFAFVATHNHFVLDRGGKVFKQSAPVIKLPAEASEDDHLELLGVLNSSTAAFWLKQNSHDKGNGGYGGGIASDAWERFYEYTGTTLKRFPLPSGSVLERARRLDSLAQSLSSVLPSSLFASAVPTAELIESGRKQYESLRSQMIAEQEELDWAVYALYGLVPSDMALPVCIAPEICLGERAFEIKLARSVAAGAETTAWFERHHSTPRETLPSTWETSYRGLVEKRLELMESDRFIELLERPEYKRRWSAEPWDEMVSSALRTWLLDKLETRELWYRMDGMPQAHTIFELAGMIEGRAEMAGVLDVLRLWSPRRDATTVEMLTDLIKGEPVPYLKEHRYKASGLRKRAEWEKTWDQQREEDAGLRAAADVSVPPNYTSTDMYPDVWSHRGKLDVPKERFISYPGASPAHDQTLMIGWAGWDHLDQGLAAYSLFEERKDEGASTDTLAAILNGLQQVMPWIMQWHNEIDPELGIALGNHLTELIAASAEALGIAVEDIKNYAPPRGAARKSRKKGN